MKQILSYKPALRSGIQDFINMKKSSANPDIPWTADLLERLLPFATDGKLLRGSVVCFSYQAFSGKPPSGTVLKAAMALELAHSALLIHDDIMDKDDWRRGKPALHRQYSSVATGESLSDADHFGIGMAICGGDAALFLAFELLSEIQADLPVSSLVNKFFAARFAAVCGGQMQDLYLQASPQAPAKKTIYELMRVKTASYTMALPLEIGAAMAGQPPAVLKRLQTIGEAAGIIFQIRDDELGTMGAMSKLGKPVGSDIREGKKTLLYYYLLKRCSSQDRSLLKTIFGNPFASPREIEAIQKIVHQYRISELLDKEIVRLQDKTSNQISKLDIADKYKLELNDLVNFCSTRQA